MCAPIATASHQKTATTRYVGSTITMPKQKSAHSLKSTTFAHFSYQIFERISSDGLHIFYNEFFLFTCCYFVFLHFFSCTACTFCRLRISFYKLVRTPNNTWRSQIVLRSSTTDGRNFCVNSFFVFIFLFCEFFNTFNRPL